jgi:hypothetical protein
MGMKHINLSASNECVENIMVKSINPCIAHIHPFLFSAPPAAA